MGIVSGFLKYKALKNGFSVVKNILRKKERKDQTVVKPYKTTSTY